ncbi:hypothetical protein AO262_01020 [Pseudomonas fluorescens ABAC62]|nr:hypothetical protein AO262_01020 [Pseudomonas fluorescens ABAC62]
MRGQVQVVRGHETLSAQNYTLLDSKVYGVRAVENGWRIVDLRDPQRLGPWLVKTRAGVWKVDLGLRLLGGQVKSAASRRYAEIEQKNLGFEREYDSVSTELKNVERVVSAAEELCEKAHLSAEGQFTDQLRLNARARFLKELEKKESVQLKKINLLDRKNANKPVDGFERKQSVQLMDMLQTMRRRMYVLTFNRREEQFSSERLERVTAQLEDEDVTVAKAAFDALTEESRKINEFQSSMVNLSFWERVFYERLLDIPGHKSYIGELELSPHGQPLDWRTLQLQTLKQLVWRRHPLPEEYDDVSRIKAAIDEAIQSAQSQKTIDEAGVLSLQQRIDGVQAILHEYAQSLALLNDYREAVPDLIHGEIDVPVGEAISSLAQESRIVLIKLLREQARNAPPTPVRQPGAGQRLVRDSRKRYLLGRVRKSQANEDIVELISPVDQTVIANLHQREGSPEFEAFSEAAAPAPRPTRSLENLKSDARRLLDRVPTVLEQAQKEALVSTLPDSVEARLTRQSTAIRTVAEKIRKALPQPADAAARALLDELEQASRRYLEQGRRLRIDMLKRLPPEEDGIAWLHAQGEVQILRIDGRIPLKRPNDFLQEYVIKDTQGRVLAYAHFHYSARSSADVPYNAGLATASVKQRGRRSFW